jgi:ubiquinone/menaquinone biosynthesis C-methylase UbiE
MDEKEAINEAFTELAPRYEKVVDNELQKFWGWSYQRFIENLVNHTTVCNGDRILDVATGTCLIPRQLFEKNQDVSIIGIDITLAMLKNGKDKFARSALKQQISLTTGDAMRMPLRDNSFDIVMCGLATHHMDVILLLSEMCRVLKPEGRLSMADVGGARLWRNPIIGFFIKILAYSYFLITENKDRAWAEAMAVSNVQTSESWRTTLAKCGFSNIEIQKLPSKSFWVPDPLLIQAIKLTNFPGEETEWQHLQNY